jgi:D-xylose transport system ATP-binding protein
VRDRAESLTAARRPLLELRGISKQFGAVRALIDVDFTCHAGEVTALVGDNGAGKSTLVKTIAGIVQADRGELRFEGRPVEITGPKAAATLGITAVYQDLALCDNLDVAANLYLGREQVREQVKVSGWLDDIAMERKATKLLRYLSVSIPDVRTAVASLSGGQRQAVAVARATMGTAKLVILDEPTAALGMTQTRQVLRLIRRLRDEGLGVVVISHNLVDVFAVADRIVVLRLGRRVAAFRTASSTPRDVVGAITGEAVAGDDSFDAEQACGTMGVT